MRHAAPAAQADEVHPRDRRRTCGPTSWRCSTGSPGRRRTWPTWCAMLVGRYCGGPKRRASPKVQAPPRCYPDVGLYHPRTVAGRITEDLAASDCPSPGAGAGTVGLLLLRSYLISGELGPLRRRHRALEARGLRVIPAFASGLDSRPAIETLSSPATASPTGGRGRVADRVLPRRRPRLQRQPARPRRCWRGSTSPTSRQPRSSSRPSRQWDADPRGAAAGRGHHDGGACPSSTAPPTRSCSAAAADARRRPALRRRLRPPRELPAAT